MRKTITVNDPDSIIEQLDDNTLLIASRPDYVMLPPELGGGRCDVLAVYKLPWKGSTETYTHYKLDKIINGKQLWVAKVDQFYWYTK